MQDIATTFIIDTSTPQGSLGFFQPHARWQEECFYSDRGHNCELFTPLQRIAAIRQPRTIEQILVGTGPGSYSGTRVGIAAAQGIAVVHRCPIIGIPSVLALPSARTQPRCLAIGDARRGDWWWAWLNHGKMSHPPQIGKLPELLAQTEQCVNIISLDLITHPELGSISNQETPTAALLWQAWLAHTPAERATYATAPLEPLYIKPPHITPAKTGHPLLRSATPSA